MSKLIVDRPELLDKLLRHQGRDLVKVVTGMRRCGKSCLLFDLYDAALRRQDIAPEQIIKINLETQQNRQLRNPGALYAHVASRIADKGKRHYVFLDEIQMVPEFEGVVAGLMADTACDVYVTGSNARFLSRDIATAFRGRSVEIRVHPFSFSEFVACRKAQGPQEISQLLNEYLLHGGLPYAVTLPTAGDRYDYLKSILELTLFRDILDRYKIRNENLLHALFDCLGSQIGSYVSASKLANTLKSNGYPRVTPDTIGNYLEHFSDSFLFAKAQRYDIKGKSYLKTLNKYYVTDLGLRNVRLNYRQIEVTHAIENVVYLELLRRGYAVDIGKNTNREIDFVARREGQLHYIQVCYSLLDATTRTRELAAFSGLDDGYKKIVITMDNDPFVYLENGYRKLHLADFLLNWQALEEI